MELLDRLLDGPTGAKQSCQTGWGVSRLVETGIVKLRLTVSTKSVPKRN